MSPTPLHHAYVTVGLFQDGRQDLLCKMSHECCYPHVVSSAHRDVDRHRHPVIERLFPCLLHHNQGFRQCHLVETCDNSVYRNVECQEEKKLLQKFVLFTVPNDSVKMFWTDLKIQKLKLPSEQCEEVGTVINRRIKTFVIMCCRNYVHKQLEKLSESKIIPPNLSHRICILKTIPTPKYF